MRLLSGRRWFRSAVSKGSIGCSGRRSGGGFGLGMGVVFIVPSTRTRLQRIKQLCESQKCAAIDHRLLGGSDTGANNFVEHPGRNTPSGVVGKLHVDKVPLAASATENLQFLTEQRMIQIENFCDL